MGRKILFITTDQQRYDALGCNGGTIARTPVVDRLAADGINYRRGYNQHTVCMPSRSTMVTGQYPRTHGVYGNGIPLPVDAPNVAGYLHEQAGYRTALVGKAHFEPVADPFNTYHENAMAHEGSTGPYRGFEHMELAFHGPGRPGTTGLQHYGAWLMREHPDQFVGFVPVMGDTGGGETGAIQTSTNPIPRELYHTDWVAHRTIAYLESLAADDDWFVWMSFPDPHHPWDPPASERTRVPWRDLDLPRGHPGSPDAIRKVLAKKPAHWLGFYDETWINSESGAPSSYRPQQVTDDQLREINALSHVMNELIDEACGRVLQTVERLGWTADTDIFFTTDHGEMQGDYGFLFKGPFHVEALMHVPYIWRPAPSAGVASGEIHDPVGHIDLAPTFCTIAGLEPAEWMQGSALPTTAGSDHERVICEWDSPTPGYGMHFQSIVRDGWLCTRYEPSTKGQPTGIEEYYVSLPPQIAQVMGIDDPRGPQSSIEYEGTEGELYDLADDPDCMHNRWNDPSQASLRADLVADLDDHLPPRRDPLLKVERPA